MSIARKRARRASARSGVTETLARVCAAHPRRTLGCWALALFAALALVATSLHGLSSSYHAVGAPQSAKAANVLARAFPGGSGYVVAGDASDVVIVHSARWTATEPAFRAFVEELVRAVRATGSATDVRSYLSGDRALVAGDERATLISLSAASPSKVKPIVALVERYDRAPGFSVSITGSYPAQNDFSKLSQSDLEHGELAFGLPAALVVLVLVFGSIMAGLAPVLMALVAILVGLGLVALLSLAFSLSVFIVNMLTGMGLALGIDYSLFVISRYREERGHGRAQQEAIARAGATASRAVLLSGSTFVIALFGMLLVPTQIMRSLAAGAIVVGVVSVAGALTLLPAVLGLLGDRVNALHVPLLGRNLGHVEAAEGQVWRKIVDRVLRRPALSLALAAAVMIAAATPIFGLHIGASGVSSLPNSLPSKQGYLALARYFPAASTYPAQIVVEGGSPAVRSDLAELQTLLARDRRFGPGTIVASATAPVMLLSLPIRGDPASPQAIAAVRELRGQLLPAALAGTGARVLVGGDSAEDADYFDAVTSPTPAVLALVLGLSFLVLLVAFRSLVLALISILLNLLSVGAAYGLLTLVFVHGVGADLLGFQHASTIEAWVPLFLFSVLFGLSMDYQVFLLSRIKEHHDRSRDTREAVAAGVASTARIITGAALIIIMVFIGFARGQLVMFQQMGFGVSVALLLDATLIRVVVLPSAMSLLGERAWYLPGFLRWLPRLEAERRESLPPAPRTAQAAATHAGSA
ncbi:MAG: MMPL family transporter [Solirubrobacteraceae bacterium]|jgi:RND superfamily putative drug exporter